MSRSFSRAPASHASDAADGNTREIGRRSLTQALGVRRADAQVDAGEPLMSGPVQRREESPVLISHEAVHAAAADGVRGTGGALPHGDLVRASFGRHAGALDGVEAYVGGRAADAAGAIGAEAYATGNQLAFARAPSLELVGHEAAHVVQQKAGVSLSGGVGAAGDPFEQHADRVGAAVARGESAEGILDEMAGSGGGGAVVQRKVGAFSMGEASPEAHAIGVLDVATTHVERALVQATQGAKTADAACLDVIPAVRDAITSLRPVEIRQQVRSEPAVWRSEETAGEGAADAELPRAVQRLMGSALRLIARARGDASAAGAIGAPTLSAVLDELRGPASRLHVDLSGTPDALVAAGGVHGSADASQIAGRISAFLEGQKDAFIGACNEEREVIEKAIAADRAFAEAMLEIFLTPAVGAVTKAVGKGVEHVAGKEIAEAAHQFGEITKLQEIASKSLLGAIPEAGDAREGTIDFIKGLSTAVANAVYLVQGAHLDQLPIDVLQVVDAELRFTTPDAVAAHVHRLVSSYRNQIEPIGQVDEDNYLVAKDHGQDATRQVAWIVGPKGQRRLAVVVRFSERVTTSLLRQGLTAIGNVGSDQPAPNPREPLVVAVNFVEWVDEDVLDVAAASNPMTVQLDQLDDGRDDAERGL